VDRRGCWRGPAVYRGGNNPQALGVDVRKGYFDFVTGEGGDPISFVMRARGVDFRAAVRIVEGIIGRALIDGRSARPAAPRFSSEELTHAELFRVGLTWRIERELQTAKLALWTEDHEAAAAKTHALTEALESALRWSTYEAAEMMSQTEPALVAECAAEARDAQIQLAHVIVAISARKAA
jgi:hypothetical protein